MTKQTKKKRERICSNFAWMPIFETNKRTCIQLNLFAWSNQRYLLFVWPDFMKFKFRYPDSLPVIFLFEDGDAKIADGLCTRRIIQTAARSGRTSPSKM